MANLFTSACQIFSKKYFAWLWCAKNNNISEYFLELKKYVGNIWCYILGSNGRELRFLLLHLRCKTINIILILSYLYEHESWTGGYIIKGFHFSFTYYSFLKIMPRRKNYQNRIARFFTQTLVSGIEFKVAIIMP